MWPTFVRGNQEAEVTVQQEQPVVQFAPQGEADINVTRGQPQVSYEPAEPEIEIQQQGEPRVQFSQSGEPRIRMEQIGQEAQQIAETEQQANQQQIAANTAEEGEPTASTTPPRLSDRDRQRIGTLQANDQPGQASPVQVSQLVNKSVVTRQGEELGDIEAVVRRNGREFVVISHGGFLGFGESEVALPLQRLSLAADGRFILRGLTEEEFEDLPRFRMATSEALSVDQSVNVSRAQ